MVLGEVDGQHSAFPISLEFSKQEHEDGNDSVSDYDNNSMAQERFILTRLKRTLTIFYWQIFKETNNAVDRRVCVS